MAFAAWILSAAPAAATVFTVTEVTDSGPGSLRAAMDSAQNCPLAPTIVFNIAAEKLTGGVAVITLSTIDPQGLSALPLIQCPDTVIDGTTQTANKGNTNDVTLGTGGIVGTGPNGRPSTGDETALPQLNGPEVEIINPFPLSTIRVQGSKAIIKGLSIHGGGSFESPTSYGAVHIANGSVTLESNVIGASAKSFSQPAVQNQDNLILIEGGFEHVIQKNLLGFARWRAILVRDDPSGELIIQENEIAGSFRGIEIDTVVPDTGQLALPRKNLIRDSIDNTSGSTEIGIFVKQVGSIPWAEVTENTVRNVDYPIVVDTTQPVSIERNVLTAGAHAAIRQIGGTKPLLISRNSILDNGGPGIDLPTLGVVTGNDGAPASGSPMDYPIFTSALVQAGTVSVTGYVGASPAGDADFAFAVIEIFKADNAPANQSGEVVAGDLKSAPHGEGAIYLGTLTANASGLFDGWILIPPGVSLSATEAITATATSKFADEDILPVTQYSSEFGPNLVFTVVLDIDGDGEVRPLTDGHLVLRYLSGLRDAALIAGDVDLGDCTRCDSTSIEGYLGSVLGRLDIDEDGEVDLLSDGVLVQRWTFGFRGADLTAGAVDEDNCAVCSDEDIEALLDTLD